VCLATGFQIRLSALRNIFCTKSSISKLLFLNENFLQILRKQLQYTPNYNEDWTAAMMQQYVHKGIQREGWSVQLVAYSLLQFIHLFGALATTGHNSIHLFL
jgi:hypothetical protein